MSRGLKKRTRRKTGKDGPLFAEIRAAVREVVDGRCKDEALCNRDRNGVVASLLFVGKLPGVFTENVVKGTVQSVSNDFNELQLN